MKITAEYDGQRVTLETRLDGDLGYKVVAGYIETGSLVKSLVYLELTAKAIELAGGVSAFVAKVVKQFNDGINAHWPTEAPPVIGDDVIAQVEDALSNLVFTSGVPFVRIP